MRKHMLHLQHNYEMMMGVNAFMLLRGAYLLKKAVDPSAEIEQYNPGNYKKYARARNTTRQRDQRWSDPRNISNPVLSQEQQDLVHTYGRAMYGGKRANVALELLDPDPEPDIPLDENNNVVVGW